MKAGRYIGLGAALFFAGGLFAQDQSNGCCKKNKPCVHISVHKQVDKYGNIISYDSVYSYSYGGNTTDTSMLNGNINFSINTTPMPQPNNVLGFMNDPFFQGFDWNISLSDMKKEMNKEMQDFLKKNGVPVIIQFAPSPTPTTPPPPKNTQKQRVRPSGKTGPAQNNKSKGVQI